MILEVETNGCTLEMKAESLDEAAINECVYNMFGTATRLSVWALQMGKLVQKAHVYGVVAAMKKPSEVRLLKICVDFTQNFRDVKICNQTYNFRDGVNMILHKLNQRS